MDEPAPRLIEFHFSPGEDFPPPLPAAKTLPEWIKAMSPEAAGASQSVPWGTVKKCPPFVDAMSCGYTLPLACDVELFLRGPFNLDVKQSVAVIGAHPPAQYPGAPFANQLVVKFINPWIIKTPPGYSTLFLPLLNRFMFPFEMLAGLVETDKFYHPVNFPSISGLQVGQRLMLPRGTPIVQAIPMKRESWQSQIVAADITRKETSVATPNNPHLYKEQAWEKKLYT